MSSRASRAAQSPKQESEGQIFVWIWSKPTYLIIIAHFHHFRGLHVGRPYAGREMPVWKIDKVIKVYLFANNSNNRNISNYYISIIINKKLDITLSLSFSCLPSKGVQHKNDVTNSTLFGRLFYFILRIRTHASQNLRQWNGLTGSTLPGSGFGFQPFFVLASLTVYMKYTFDFICIVVKLLDMLILVSLTVAGVGRSGWRRLRCSSPASMSVWRRSRTNCSKSKWNTIDSIKWFFDQSLTIILFNDFRSIL